MKKLIFIIAIIVLLVTGCSENKKSTPPANNETNEQQSTENQDKKEAVLAPDFELESLDGTTIKLSELRDKNVIVNFWATWCSFCVIEMPDLQKLQDTYKDDLLVLTVNVGESKEVVQEFMKENNLSLTVALDEKMDVANTYGIRSYPTTIAINKNGEVISGYVGMLKYEQMEQLYSFFE